MYIENIPRVTLANLPTPVEQLHNISYKENMELWIKRDDLTGLAFGGNKLRKLEFLMADALKKNCDTLITTGGQQSNHARLTAAAAAKKGLQTSLLLLGEKPDAISANYLLDLLLGAKVKFLGDIAPAQLEQQLEQEKKRLLASAANPYIIPLGGSNALGVIAYATAVKELKDQMPDIKTIVTACGSAGTQAGIILGCKLFMPHCRVVGISVWHSTVYLTELLLQLCKETIDQFNLPVSIEQEDINVLDGYIGDGYGTPTETGLSAIRTFARKEGVILDPTYTGKAAAGLLDLAGKKVLTQPVLFWHTGGTPGIFALEQCLIEEQN